MDLGFLNKISDFTRTAGDKAGDLLEINRLNAHIRAEERTIKEVVEKIGAYYVDRFDQGELKDENVELMYREILNCREKIASHQAQLGVLQSATAKKTKTSTEKICSFCGASNSASVKFCGECGNKLEEVAEPTIINDGEHCLKCGALLNKNLKFCGECGEKIEGSTEA